MATRKQSGCVVFRYNRKFEYEILLVTSSDGKDWVFPKGGVEADLTSQQSASKEVYEEAGVHGRILNTLGTYGYNKQGKPQKVVMYSMLYTNDAPDWPEKKLRKRKWFSLKDAKKKVPKLLKPLLKELESSSMLALASANIMDQVGQQLRILPVLAEHAGEVQVDTDTVSVVVPNGEDRLTIRIEDWGQHPLSQKLTIHYDYEHEGVEGKHFNHATLGTVAAKVGRIIGRFLTGHIH